MSRCRQQTPQGIAGPESRRLLSRARIGPRRKPVELQRAFGNHALQRILASVAGSPDVSSASPLDSRTRARMAARFGRDFPEVRVHTDADAAASAASVDAAAYTVGADIVFNTGMYSPDTLEGEALLAHELTHVIQQSGAGRSTVSSVSDPASAIEREADDAANSVVNQPFAVGAMTVTGRLGSSMLCRDTLWQQAHQAVLAVWRGGLRIAYYARGARREAEQNASYVGYAYHLGPGDALRHCTWAALTALETFFNVAPPYRTRDQVRNVLLAHEDAVSGRGPIDSRMDQHNNEVGISLAEQLWSRAAWDRALAAEVSRRALDNGDLRMIVPGESSLRTTANWRALPRNTWP